MSEPAHDDPVGETLRLDVWLHRSRLFKTRGLAARMVNLGRIRITRDGTTRRVRKSHFGLRRGDQVTLVRGGEAQTLWVSALPARRGPASEAQACYRDTPPD